MRKTEGINKFDLCMAHGDVFIKSRGEQHRVPVPPSKVFSSKPDTRNSSKLQVKVMKQDLLLRQAHDERN